MARLETNEEFTSRIDHLHDYHLFTIRSSNQDAILRHWDMIKGWENVSVHYPQYCNDLKKHVFSLRIHKAYYTKEIQKILVDWDKCHEN